MSNPRPALYDPRDNAVLYTGVKIPVTATHVFTDGGLISSNPSMVGGTWAWCAVESDSGNLNQYGVPDCLCCQMIMYASGVLKAANMPDRTVGNNLMEVVALLMAMESMPAGWSGRIYSDSGCALDAIFRYPKKHVYMTDGLWRRILWAKDKLGSVNIVQVHGHPRKADMEVGYRVDVEASLGQPGEVRRGVSVYNKWCDDRCKHESILYKNAHDLMGDIG